MLADFLWAVYGITRTYPLALVAIAVFGTVLAAFGIVAPRVIRRRTDG